MTTTNLYTTSLGADGNRYRIDRAVLAGIRDKAMEETDKATAARHLPCWDEHSAHQYCQAIGQAVQTLGVRHD